MADGQDVEQIIKAAVEEIWNQFDADGSGYLDKEEARKFVSQTLDTTGNGGFSDAEFDECFSQFDNNNDGQISKSEMVTFIRQVAHI